jgi:peptidoglycan/LPS O-acetylase OafA/YrhL
MQQAEGRLSMNFFRLNTGHFRIFGLDILRAIAILFVVFGHSAILLPEKYKSYVRIITLDGVAIFFVLSGFLIGGILIKLLEKEKPTFPVLFNFWTRRWLRTLPIYLLLLTFVILFTYLLKPQRLPDEWYRYYIFTQNLNHPLPTFFGESWSLSIEEWFYLLVPIALFVTLNVFRQSVKKTTISIIILGIIAVITYRYQLFTTSVIKDSTQANLLILRQVLTRLDAIMFGVLGAFMSFYYPSIWKKGNHITFVLVGFILMYLLKIFNDSHISEYSIVYLPAIKAITVLFMLPYFSQLKGKTSFFTKSITFVSLVSYSMYLINRTIVIDICIKYGLHDNLLNKHSFGEFWIVEYFLFWLLTFGISYLLYISIEVPFMKLRDFNKK